MNVQNKLRRTLVAAFAILAFVAPTHTASAGSNGQQLSILQQCAKKIVLKKVTVTGTNNAGKTVTWTGTPNSTEAFTNGWWWKGRVYITYTFRNPLWGSDATNGFWSDVPTVFNRDFYPVWLDAGLQCSAV